MLLSDMTNNDNVVDISHKKLIRIYLWLHLVLMLIVSIGIWLPLFFILYGGIPAVILLRATSKKVSCKTSVFKQRTIYLFSLLEVAHTIALLYVGALAFCDVLWGNVLATDCMKDTIFTNPEFYFIMPGIYLNALYLPTALIWFIAYIIWRLPRAQ